MSDLDSEVVKLSEENNKLKKELEELRLRVATSRPQEIRISLPIVMLQLRVITTITIIMLIF